MSVESRLFVSPSQENFVKGAVDPELRDLELDHTLANLSERVESFVWAQEDF